MHTPQNARWLLPQPAPAPASALPLPCPASLCVSQISFVLCSPDGEKWKGSSTFRNLLAYLFNEQTVSCPNMILPTSYLLKNQLLDRKQACVTPSEGQNRAACFKLPNSMHNSTSVPVSLREWIRQGRPGTEAHPFISQHQLCLPATTEVGFLQNYSLTLEARFCQQSQP